MTELRFVGEDLRWLYETLIEACEVTSREGVRPIIVVNGKRFDDLLKVAQLLPDEPLPSHHQLAADAMFQKKQSGYRRTAYNIAHRANQTASDFTRREALLRMGEEQRAREKQEKIAEKEKQVKLVRRKLSSEQIRGARALVRMEQTALAELSGVPLATIARFESKDGLISANGSKFADAIVSALEAAGVEFIAENGGGAGVRLRKTKS